jgi:hypothetical protein
MPELFETQLSEQQSEFERQGLRPGKAGGDEGAQPQR